MSLPLVSYALKAALRDRLFVSTIFMMVMIGAGAVFLGGTAINENDKFVLVFASGAMRVAAVLTLSAYISFYIRSLFDRRDVQFLLSRPVTRSKFVISHGIAFACLAVLISVMMFVVLAFLSKGDVTQGLLLWWGTIALELIVVSSATLFFSLVLKSSVAGISATVGIYVMARMLGTVLGIVDSGLIESDIVMALGKFLETISVVFPRLDLMGQASWLIYGVEEVNTRVLLSVLFAPIVYAVLLVYATCVDFVRRQF